jgi:hypothetical protein
MHFLAFEEAHSLFQFSIKILAQFWLKEFFDNFILISIANHFMAYLYYS